MPTNCENTNERFLTALLQCKIKICTICNYILSFKKLLFLIILMNGWQKILTMLPYNKFPSETLGLYSSWFAGIALYLLHTSHLQLNCVHQRTRWCSVCLELKCFQKWPCVERDSGCSQMTAYLLLAQPEARLTVQKCLQRSILSMAVSCRVDSQATSCNLQHRNLPPWPAVRHFVYLLHVLQIDGWIFT